MRGDYRFHFTAPLQASSRAGSLGLYGFGAAARLPAIQVARGGHVAVYAMTRDARHQRLAMEMGAVWEAARLIKHHRNSTLPSSSRLPGRLCPRRWRSLRKVGP